MAITIDVWEGDYPVNKFTPIKVYQYIFTIDGIDSYLIKDYKRKNNSFVLEL